MQRLLLDQGLPGGTSLASALAALGLEVHAVGSPGAPALGSSDEVNCKWCSTKGAILVTHDRGRKNREIHGLLDQHSVDCITVLRELRRSPPHHLARALLNAEGKMDQIVEGRRRLRHQLRPGGGLRKP